MEINDTFKKHDDTAVGLSFSQFHEVAMENAVDVRDDGMVSPDELVRISHLSEIEKSSSALPFLEIDKEASPNISIPSFFSLQEAKHLNFSVDEFIPMVEKGDDTVVSVNLDCENPANSLKIIEEHREGLQQKVNLLKAVSLLGFKDVNVDVIRDTANLSSLNEEQFNTIITELIFNKTIREDKTMIQKLYKLKNIEELVNTSMNMDNARLSFNAFLGQIKEAIIKYEAIIKKEISTQMSHLDFGTRKTDENTINGLKEHIRSLEELKGKCEFLQDELLEYERLSNLELFEECDSVDEILLKIESFKAFSELSHMDIFSDCKSNSEVVEKIKSFLILKDSLSEDFMTKLRTIEGFNEVSADSLFDKIMQLTEQNKFCNSVILEYDKEKEESLKAYQALTNKAEELTECVRSLEAENQLLKEKEFSSKENESSSAYLEALDEIEEDKDVVEAPRKKMGIGKKIAIGFGAFFGVVFLYFFTISFLSVEEVQSPSTKKEFSNAIKPAPAAPEVKVAPPVVEPASEVSVIENKIPNAVASVVEPTPPEYDFNVLLPEETFKLQKFDIYVDDSRKVRVNGKNFVAGETINGYKFIKTLKSGKILFMNEADGKSLWLTMN